MRFTISAADISCVFPREAGREVFAFVPTVLYENTNTKSRSAKFSQIFTIHYFQQSPRAYAGALVAPRATPLNER